MWKRSSISRSHKYPPCGTLQISHSMITLLNINAPSRAMAFKGLLDKNGFVVDLCQQYTLAGLNCPRAVSNSAELGRVSDSFSLGTLIQAAGFTSLDAPMLQNASFNRCHNGLLRRHVIYCIHSVAISPIVLQTHCRSRYLHSDCILQFKIVWGYWVHLSSFKRTRLDF